MADANWSQSFFILIIIKIKIWIILYIDKHAGIVFTVAVNATSSDENATYSKKTVGMGMSPNRHFCMEAQFVKLPCACPLAIKWAPPPKHSLTKLPISPLFSNLGQRYTSRYRNTTAANFDDAAYEAERLSLDAAARESMAQKSLIESADPKAWKWVIRKRVWDLMEARNIAQFPRPVHHRIPNFVGAHIAADKVSCCCNFWVQVDFFFLFPLKTS